MPIHHVTANVVRRLIHPSTHPAPLHPVSSTCPRTPRWTEHSTFAGTQRYCSAPPVNNKWARQSFSTLGRQTLDRRLKCRRFAFPFRSGFRRPVCRRQASLARRLFSYNVTICHSKYLPHNAVLCNKSKIRHTAMTHSLTHCCA